MKQIFAYLYERKDFDFSKISFEGLDYVNYSFGLVKDGKLSIEHLKCLDKMLESKRDFKVTLSIGGWNADGFSDAVLTEESRKTFIDSIIKVMKEKKLDGIDIDWEWPGVEYSPIKYRECDAENFILFMKGLYKAIKDYNSDCILTFAAGASYRCAEVLDLKTLNSYLDYFNIMTYDMGDSKIKGSHHTNLYKNDVCKISAHDAIMTFSKGGIDIHKIVMGSAFYGKVFSYTKDHKPERGAYPYKEIVNLTKYQYKFDEQAQAPILYDDKEYVTYDDPRSLTAKCEYINKNDLAGIMFWELASDNGELLHTINTILK